MKQRTAGISGPVSPNIGLTPEGSNHVGADKGTPAHQRGQFAPPVSTARAGARGALLPSPFSLLHFSTSPPLPYHGTTMDPEYCSGDSPPSGYRTFTAYFQVPEPGASSKARSVPDTLRYSRAGCVPELR